MLLVSTVPMLFSPTANGCFVSLAVAFAVSGAMACAAGGLLGALYAVEPSMGQLLSDLTGRWVQAVAHRAWARGPRTTQ